MPRKSVLKPSPSRPELDRLLKEAADRAVTDDLLREQRVSFAYGNAPDTDKITKESVRNAIKSVRIAS